MIMMVMVILMVYFTSKISIVSWQQKSPNDQTHDFKTSFTSFSASQCLAEREEARGAFQVGVGIVIIVLIMIIITIVLIVIIIIIILKIIILIMITAITTIIKINLKTSSTRERPAFALRMRLVDHYCDGR